MSTITTAFSSALKKAKTIQGSSNNRKLSGSAKTKLEVIYEKLLTLLMERQTQGKAALADFLSQIPVSDWDSWFDHAAGTVRKISSDQAWNRLGSEFEHHERLMLNICTQIVGVFSGLQSAFKKEYFSAIASCIAVRKRTALLDPMVAESVCWTIHMALSIVSVTESWTPAKLFKKFDSCGVLVSFIRCSVQYPPEGQIGFGEGVLAVYEMLMQDKNTICKFQKGQPCGDATYAILSGMDGHPMKSEKVVGYLRTLVKTALLVDDPINEKFKDENRLTRRMCRYCNKAEDNPEFQLSLKTCSRCKQAHYCTQDCQKKDWKKHRLVCCKHSLAANTDNTSEKIVLNFMARKHTHILARMAVVFMETGMKKNELVLVIDNEPGKDGSIAPAMRHPPEFELVPFETVSREHSQCAETLEMHRSNMTKNHCLSLLLNGGSFYIAKCQSRMPISGHEAYSDKAVDAFVAYLYKGNLTFLKQMFPREDQQIAIKKILAPEHNEKIETMVECMPNKNLKGAVYLMAAVKRFGGTKKSLQKFGFSNELADLVLACYD